MKRIILIGLSALLMFAGLVIISCKNDSKKTKTAGKLDDSTFVELAARQNLLIQEYYIKIQQVKSDSEKVILSKEFNEKTEKILGSYGISREQIDNYLEEMLSDTQKLQELHGKIVDRIKEIIAEASKTENQ